MNEKQLKSQFTERISFKQMYVEQLRSSKISD